MRFAPRRATGSIHSLQSPSHFLAGAASLLERRLLGKVNELMVSSDFDSLPQSKSCMDTFLTPPFSLNLMLKTQDGIQLETVRIVSRECEGT